MEQMEGWIEEKFSSVPTVGHYSVPVTAVGVYLVVLYVLRGWMKDRQPLELRLPLFLHNAFLCAISVALTLGTVFSVLRMWSAHGLFNTYCGLLDSAEAMPLMNWCYLFYLSKYYELFDTLFLVLRKRSLSFLHVFHHASVVIVCWAAIHEQIFMGWITCINNASIHVAMYYYFAMQALGYNVWWKKYLTSVQIVQFVIDSTTSLLFPYFIYFTSSKCMGSMPAWFLANFTGVTFFFLFVSFYRSTYSDSERGNKGDRASLKTSGNKDSSSPRSGSDRKPKIRKAD